MHKFNIDDLVIGKINQGVRLLRICCICFALSTPENVNCDKGFNDVVFRGISFRSSIAILRSQLSI